MVTSGSKMNLFALFLKTTANAYCYISLALLCRCVTVTLALLERTQMAPCWTKESPLPKADDGAFVRCAFCTLHFN